MQQLIPLEAESPDDQQQQCRPTNTVVRLQVHLKLGLPVLKAVCHGLGC